MLPTIGKADFQLAQLKSSPTVRKVAHDIIEKYEVSFFFYNMDRYQNIEGLHKME
jgi:hypothetical protein